MPTFESEATYLDCNIKKEIKIEPCENFTTGQKSNQETKDSNYHSSSSIHEKSSEEYNEKNMVPNSKIKKEKIEFDEMPIFEKDSTYLEEAIKKEIKIEPYCGHEKLC